MNSLRGIISALPQDIIDYIENVSRKYKVVSQEERLRTAYKYRVWHEANFINGVHKESHTIRDLVEATCQTESQKTKKPRR